VLLAVVLMVFGSAVSVAVTLRPGTTPPAAAPDALPAAPPLGASSSTATRRPATTGTTAAALPSLVTIETVLESGQRSAGTGIVLTADGRVATNHHVVAGATALTVTAVDGHTYRAAVVGYDRSADVAVLQLVGAVGLQPAAIGSDRALTVGDPVVVVGKVDGRGVLAATSGRIAALARSVVTAAATSSEVGSRANRLAGSIEVAARVAPGMSGGALLGPDGVVVGMTTAGDGGADLAAQTGFAIPMADVVATVGRIVAGVPAAGLHVGPSASLGVRPAPGGAVLVPTTAGAVAGVLVDAADPGSPAWAAGVGPGDVVTALGAVPVPSVDALADALAARRPGDRALLAWTDALGRARTASVVLVDGPVG
jgi:S1-C subfamily serine protease